MSLINREDLIAEYDRVHVGAPGCARKLMVDAPEVVHEIIRCRDCKYWHREIYNGIEYFNFSSCDLNHCGDGHNFYCADAERRTDETD